MSQIIALKKPSRMSGTGAMSDYHIATRYYVDEAANYAEVGFSTYVSEAVTLKTGSTMRQFSNQPKCVENGSVLAGGELVYDIENVVE